MNLPLALLDRFRREPDAEAGWLALADDLAVVVRGYYPLFGEIVASGKAPEQALRFFTKRGIGRLARQLREGQERGLDHRFD